MSQLRLNPLTGRWVTIVAERAQRPTDFAPASPGRVDSGRPCPFCPGNEESTLPALETIGKGGKWRVRVMPNLYPAFMASEAFAVHHAAPCTSTPRPAASTRCSSIPPTTTSRSTAIDDDAAGEMMLVLKRRFLEHAATTNIRYTQAIINHGREAGASIAHPHGQLLGLPFVPGEVLEEERAFSPLRRRLPAVHHLEAEMATGERVVVANDDVVMRVPVLERLAVRDADHPAPPRVASAAPTTRRSWPSAASLRDAIGFLNA